MKWPIPGVKLLNNICQISLPFSLSSDLRSNQPCFQRIQISFATNYILNIRILRESIRLALSGLELILPTFIIVNRVRRNFSKEVFISANKRPLERTISLIGGFGGAIDNQRQ